MSFKGSQTDEGIGCALIALALCLLLWAFAGFPGLR